MSESNITLGLWPAVRIHVSEQSVRLFPMLGGRSSERGLRENGFHFSASPVLSPAVEKLMLPFSKEGKPFDIDALGVIVGVVDVVWSWSLLRDFSRRPRLPLSVFYDCKADFSKRETGVIRSDLLLDRSWIKGIWEMPSLTPFYHFHIGTREHVSAV